MLDCKLCGEFVATTYLCVHCNKFKDAINLYGREVTWEVIQKVLVRNEKQRGYKIDKIKKEQQEEIQTDL